MKFRMFEPTTGKLVSVEEYEKTTVGLFELKATLANVARAVSKKDLMNTVKVEIEIENDLRELKSELKELKEELKETREYKKKAKKKLRERTRIEKKAFARYEKEEKQHNEKYGL